MASKTFNVALIGSKFMGRTHSNAYLKVAKYFEDIPIEPVMHTLAARNPDETAAFAKQWGWQNHTTDWKEAATSKEIDLVDVGTPNDVHKEQAIAALEAGKHVACEKPLAGTLDDAREMLNAAKKANKQKTFVWYNYRRCPAVAFAHNLVKQGKLGRIYHVRAAYLQDWGGPDTPLVWRFQGNTAGSGAHGDLNAHVIDMARFITGDEIDEVTGAIEKTFIKERPLLDDPSKKGESTVDDAVLFLAQFKQGAVASFEATRLSTGDKNRNRIEVHGEKGAVRFNFERMNELEWYDATDEAGMQGWTTINVSEIDGTHPYFNYWWKPGHIIGYEHGFINEAADICYALGGQQPITPLPDFADAFETQKVLHAALESARNRGPVKLSEIK